MTLYQKAFSSNFFSLPEFSKNDIQKSDTIAYTRTPHFQAQRLAPCQMHIGPLRSCLFYDLIYYMKGSIVIFLVGAQGVKIFPWFQTIRRSYFAFIAASC